MTPLCVTAQLDGPLHLGPYQVIHLDGLLAEVKWRLSGLPPATTPEEVVRFDLPLALEPAGRFHLASASVGAYERMERRHIVRRFPMAEAQVLGEAARVSTRAGTHRDYRIPLEVGHIEQDRLTWYAEGEEDGVRELLAWVTHIGRRRAVGLGRVRAWTVEACDRWSGFPVVARDDAALRNLPPDWPGLGAHWLRTGRLTFPYHHLGGPSETVAAPMPNN